MYCFSMPMGTLITRYEGKVALTGNCNFNRLNQYPVKNWKGGQIHELDSSVYHLMRGEIFKIGNKSIFTFGGANSIDKPWRIPNISWWKEEIPSYEEMDRAITNLHNAYNYVDVILTHTCPSIFINTLLESKEPIIDDPVSKMCDYFYENIQYKSWFFGHWHLNKIIDNKHHTLYDSIIQLN